MILDLEHGKYGREARHNTTSSSMDIIARGKYPTDTITVTVVMDMVQAGHLRHGAATLPLSIVAGGINRISIVRCYVDLVHYNVGAPYFRTLESNRCIISASSFNTPICHIAYFYCSFLHHHFKIKIANLLNLFVYRKL